MTKRRDPLLSPKPIVTLEAGMPAADAVIRYFSKLVGVIRAKLPGTLDRIDPEALHDLRVAVRRTRSMLPRAETVFGRSVIRPFRAGFREVQRQTNRSRDLDVMLLDLDGFRRILEVVGRGASIQDVEAAIREDRASEQVRLRRFLSSRCLTRLLDRWEDFLAGGWEAPASAPGKGETVADRLSYWLIEALSRVQKQYRQAAASGSEADMHRLRIAFKKLRYLVELGQSLYDPELYRQIHSALKATQDVLGRFNDLSVGERTIRSLKGHVDRGTAQALDLLAAGLAARRREMMTDCLAVSSAFFTGDGWKRWRDLTPR